MALECAICLDVLLNPDHYAAIDDDDLMDPAAGAERTPVLTRCGHMYHRDCLEGWMSSHGNPRSGTCPQCRDKLTRRQLTTMDFQGQHAATKTNRPSTMPATGNQAAGNVGRCFSKDAHEKLSKDYENLLKTFRQKKDQLAIIQGEKASLQQALVNAPIKRPNTSQQTEQGTKRMRLDSDP